MVKRENRWIAILGSNPMRGHRVEGVQHNGPLPPHDRGRRVGAASRARAHWTRAQ